MLSADELISYTSASIDTCANEDLRHRLSLYQVFLKLYEQHRGLLDEILNLENSGSKSLAGVTLPYVQGVILDGSVHLTTNLLQGKTQALLQPQQVWILGRDPHKTSIAIPDNRLSRCHASIHYNAEKGFSLVDLGSRNGSFINGERVWRSTLLKDGDRVRLGSLSFVFFMCQTAQMLESLPPEMLTHQIEAQRAKQPLTHLSEVNLPEANLPEANLPEANLPDLPAVGQTTQPPKGSEANPLLQGTFTFMRSDLQEP
jgi:pSer/pThr/pTyr-binding forkhead associated (FHA) protein